MYCNECGHNNRNDRKFCSECGKPLKDYAKTEKELILPEQVDKEKEQINKFNKNNKRFSLVLICLLVAAIALTVTTFLLTDMAQLIVSVIAAACYVAFFIVGGIKIKRLKNKRKK